LFRHSPRNCFAKDMRLFPPRFLKNIQNFSIRPAANKWRTSHSPSSREGIGLLSPFFSTGSQERRSLPVVVRLVVEGHLISLPAQKPTFLSARRGQCTGAGAYPFFSLFPPGGSCLPFFPATHDMPAPPPHPGGDAVIFRGTRPKFFGGKCACQRGLLIASERSLCLRHKDDPSCGGGGAGFLLRRGRARRSFTLPTTIKRKVSSKTQDMFPPCA